MSIEKLKKWINEIIHPKEILNDVGTADWATAFKDILLSSFLAGLIWGFFAMILGSTVIPVPLIGVGMGIAMWISAMIGLPILAVVDWIILGIMIFITAKLLGGKADFSRNTIDIGETLVPMIFVSGLVGWIPFIGWFLVGIIMLIWLYQLTIAIEKTHNLSTGKAVLTWLIWGILWAILAAILGVVMIAAFFASAPAYAY